MTTEKNEIFNYNIGMNLISDDELINLSTRLFIKTSF